MPDTSGSGPVPPPSPPARGDIVRPDPVKLPADALDAPDPSAPAYRLSGAIEATGDAAVAAPNQPAFRSALRTSGIVLEPKMSFAPAAVRADLPRGTGMVQPDDLIEVEFDQGERLWMRGDDFRINFVQPAARRDAAGEELEVPAALGMAPAGLATRGPVAWAIKSLKVFGVDLQNQSAKLIASRVDFPREPSKSRQIPGRIYRCSTAAGAFELTEANVSLENGGQPWLLFIHGTLSSTWGSFGELWSEARKNELAALRAKYADRVIAFEHATLTESPVQNAIQLAERLPARATLHLVTYSRGGLVGELLCRGSVISREADAEAGAGGAGARRLPAFTEEELSTFAAAGGSIDREADIRALRRLDALLREKQITVERFVRVACPALGTTLASGRLDRWLSVIGTLAGAALPGTPLGELFADLGDFIAGVVEQRTDPATLPGLEAQMPDSPLIRMLNWPGVRVAGDLAVIAGDIDPASVWARLLVWLSDRFYDGDHDLVVNTPSMWGGARRAGLELLSAHKGPAVTHFSYFAERSSAERLVAALTAGAAAPAGFEPLKKPSTPIARSVVPRGAEASRPVLFVLPGIMGSELADSAGPIWIATASLFRGGLRRLAIDAGEIRPVDPLARSYGDIIEYLGATHTVVPFAYDWRIRVSDEADRLAASVREQLDRASRQNQPVRFLAHSMGGLVVRAMIARHQALWREICAYEGARFVMLGTPNRGTHAMTELLVGRAVLLRKLARLDIRNSSEDLLGIISRYPGVLAMLPRNRAGEDYFSPDTWRVYHARDTNGNAGWSVPAAADLSEARELAALLDSGPVDPDRMIYVAGSADVTAAGMRLAYNRWRQREEIEFVATASGDGRVTWESGILPGVPVWYMDVEHGNLASHPPAFPALQELLVKGTTTLLDKEAPAARPVADVFPMPPAEDDRYPGEEDLADAAMGAGPRARRSAARREPPLQVRVVHGNLAFSRHIIAVGHYAGDSIVSAEKALDLALDGALTRRHQMGLYPGPIGTSAVFTNPRCANPRFFGLRGAIVVGLGTVGSLTASQLTRSVTRALLEYALEQRSQPRPVDGGGCDLGVSSLLIGTGAGGISVDDSVYALIRGVQAANDTLELTGQQERIRTLEFMELWEDRAIQALEALHLLASRSGLRELLAIESALDTRDGGLRRLSYAESPDWWQRLQITGAGGGLRFAAITTRARTEVQLLSTQRELVDQFIDRALAATRNDRGIARTLFELLLPNDLKDSAPDQDNVVLLLDEEAAQYPWELLEDGLRPGRKPWVVEHGLLRQLESEEFRRTVQGVTENTALIIGDPISDQVELTGAQAEAEAVWRTLQQGFAAVKYIRPTSEQVIAALFERQYKVLHLAGHGVYRHVPAGSDRCQACGQPLAAERRSPHVTGMVIGKGMFLRPAEVQQMRAVPDLVFINCCHLGRVEPSAERAFPRLAANVATEFIRMGVRAVVAAGWAVDDAPAASFATTFYEEMLKGVPFGAAIKAAREITFNRYPGSNTWGAYQCYGDPGYRLVMPAHAARQEAGPPRVVSPAHAVQLLSNIAARLNTESTSSREYEIEALTRIAKALKESDWIGRGAVAAALARAYGEAGLLDQAIGFYQQALSAEDGGVTAKDIEQLANLQVRHAFRQWQSRAADANEEVRRTCIDRIARAIGILATLSGPALGAASPAQGQTSERLSLMAAAYKRLALVQPGGERVDSLGQMEALYRQAAMLAAGQDGDVAYPLLNAVAAALARSWQSDAGATGRETLAAAAARDLDAARTNIAARLAKGPNFWLLAMMVDADLLQAIADGSLDEEKAHRIARAYLEYRGVASERQFGSVYAQIDFMSAMARDPAIGAHLATLRRLVQSGATPPRA